MTTDENTYLKEALEGLDLPTRVGDTLRQSRFQNSLAGLNLPTRVDDLEKVRSQLKKILMVTLCNPSAENFEEIKVVVKKAQAQITEKINDLNSHILERKKDWFPTGTDFFVTFILDAELQDYQDLKRLMFVFTEEYLARKGGKAA